jgi:hypothetical protein
MGVRSRLNIQFSMSKLQLFCSIIIILLLFIVMSLVKLNMVDFVPDMSSGLHLLVNHFRPCLDTIITFLFGFVAYVFGRGCRAGYFEFIISWLSPRNSQIILLA